ncbi:hypothetical protein D3C73_1340020 [compost metagenome]
MVACLLEYGVRGAVDQVLAKVLNASDQNGIAGPLDRAQNNALGCLIALLHRKGIIATHDAK